MFGLHPLQEDTSKLSETELTNKIIDLQKKVGVAYSLGNTHLVGQINMMLAAYEEDLQKRCTDKLAEMQKKSKKDDDSSSYDIG